MRRIIIGMLAMSLLLVAALPAAAARPDSPGSNSNRAPAPGEASIAEIVVASATAEEEAEFTLLLAALQYTGLTDVFTGGDQYTVFAPTDQAFLNLVGALDLDSGVLEKEGPFAAIDELLGPDTVASVLKYHVVEGRRAANSVVPPVRDRSINTLLGAPFTVSSDGTITDLAAQSVDFESPDLVNVSASNGIIHVIDTVLLPLPPEQD